MTKTKKIIFYWVSIIIFAISMFVLSCASSSSLGFVYIGLYGLISFSGMFLYFWLDTKRKFG